MSVSYYEMFTGQDWERASTVGGQMSCVSCVAVAIASMALGYSVDIGLWTLFVGLLIATWEVPFVYSLFPKCEDIKTIALERMHLKHPLVKCVLYVLLSILCYEKKTLCILAGVILNVESLLLIFAYINIRSDAQDGLTTDDDVHETASGTGKLLSSNKFGTF